MISRVVHDKHWRHFVSIHFSILKKKNLYKKYWKLNWRTDTEVTRIAWELIDELDIFIRGNVNFEYNLKKKKLISQMSLCFAVLFFSWVGII